ncbi:hypothetical protein CROQUDRAFT_699735 [Cronartium quercuum f. sp. fusiforme G11]|uniref:Pali-domain-containing protein n=1 Tax=Cronartium quercuum f. sp. fusiforme G11 TaxID=708437 RepID=A0A9P6TCA1_9BASI|nr:hypothetical protein CROQUDRAFT_699735 [Cronartium quercuum f. sp. fusiforme G11]
MIGPNTLGTIILLVATIILILVTSSSPLNPSIYFLAADVQSSVSTQNVAGIIRLGVFGYCIETPERMVCSDIKIGYALDPNVLLSLSLPESFRLTDSIIKGLTYVLVIHAIAAAFAALSVLSGIVSHIRDFQRTCWTSILSSCAASLALIGFIFDFIIFGIARKRMNDVEPRIVRAIFGPAIWMTLIAWVFLAFSGCFFCAGRCLFSGDRRKKRHSIQIDEKFHENKGSHRHV